MKSNCWCNNLQEIRQTQGRRGAFYFLMVVMRPAACSSRRSSKITVYTRIKKISMSNLCFAKDQPDKIITIQLRYVMLLIYDILGHFVFVYLNVYCSSKFRVGLQQWLLRFYNYVFEEYCFNPSQLKFPNVFNYNIVCSEVSVFFLLLCQRRSTWDLVTHSRLKYFRASRHVSLFVYLRQ